MRNLLRWLFALALTGGLMISLMGLLSFAAWQGDMITPFRLQLLLCAVTAFGLSFYLRDKRLSILAAVTLASALIPVAVRLCDLRRLPAASAGDQSLSLISTNVLCDNRHYDRVLAMVEREHPDVLVAVETSPAWIKGLRPLETHYRYTLTPDIGIFGISVYARQAFTARMDRIGRARMPLAELHFKDFTLFVVHPMPPGSQKLVTENRLYLNILSERIRATQGRIIIAGDFNATPWSHSLSPLIATGAEWPHGSGLAYTWPTNRPGMAIQIDHILTRGAKAGSYRVLAPVGSDHFPVRADLVL